MTDKRDKPVVNLTILQSIEDYVETSGKFRTKCASFKIPGRDSGGANTLYIPYCDKQRFDFGEQLNDYRGHGVFIPPEMGKRWSRMDFEVFRTHFHDIRCPRPCRGYRNKTVAALLGKVLSVFGAKLHKMPVESPATPPSVLKQAINAVPAVKYALGVGGIISVIAIVGGFRIDYRVAFLGTVVMLVLMTVLLVFANASSRPQSTFKVPAIILTWFCLVLFMATAIALFSSVFFGKPLDLRTLLAPVHAGQMPVEKHGTVEVLPPTTDRVDVTGKRAPSQSVTAQVGHEKKKRDSQGSTTNASGSIVNNGGVINNPTINNNALSPQKGIYELNDERRDRFLKLLSAQTAPRDTVRIGCTSWSETACVAAGRFLLIFSEAGWQIEQNKVFRLEPQIPIGGVAIVTRTPADEPKEPLPPHQGRWRLMDESHKTIYWAFNSIGIPAGEGSLGIYFGSEPK